MNVRIYEQILGLDIAVDDVRSVAERDALQHLIDVVPQAFGLFSNESVER
jgi:hypothetical protein